MSGDENLRKVYNEEKDIYAWSASLVFKKPYEECLEFRPDGTVNYEGKQRRANLKAIGLGITYSKGVKAIAEDLGIPETEAQNMFDAFFNSFPKVRKFMEDTQRMARE